jgi:hypothetical protein
MKTRNLVLIIFSVVLFYACTKDNDPSNNNPQNNPGDSTYNTAGNPLLIDDFVLYTSNGAHRDQQMIKDFVTRHFPDDVNTFYYGQSTVTNHNISQSLVFINDKTVKLKDIRMEIVSKTATEMLLSPMDSTNMPGSDLLGHCKILYDQVPQYNPYSICKTAGGNCKKYRKVYPIIISGNDYYLPILNYAVVSNCSIYTYSSRPLPNYFNKDITNGLLTNTDSVLVQVARLKLGK